MPPAVASSSYTLDTIQRDGRRYVTEAFVLDDGTERSSMYLAEKGTDYDAHLALMVDAWNEQLAVPEPVETKEELQEQIAVIQGKIDAIDMKAEAVVDDGK